MTKKTELHPSVVKIYQNGSGRWLNFIKEVIAFDG